MCFEGDFQWIKYNQDNTVTVSFTPQREGLCEAILELTFCDHKQKADFVIKRTLSGRAKQPAGGQTKQPSDGRTKQPSDGRTKQPTGGQIKQPAGGKTKQPAGGQTKQPAGGQTKQPSGGRTEQPADGQTIQPAGGQAAGGKSEGHLQIEYWPNAGPQPADDQLDYYARIPADEELLDNDGTGISVSHPDGLDFGIVERMRRNGPFATPSSLLTIKHEDDLPAVAFVLGRTKTLDGYDREWVIAFP